MLPHSYGDALNNAGYAQAMNQAMNNRGSGFKPSAQYAASAGNAAAAQDSYAASQQRLAAQAAWQAQQQAARQNTYSNRVELEKELANNEIEIKALQNERENMRAQWGDLDSMDRQLAANRASVGDFANARAHQNDIIARRNDRNKLEDTAMQWRWQAAQNKLSMEADQQKQAKADIRRIIGEIEEIDTQIPYHTEVGAVNSLKAKRARLVNELAGYGVDFWNDANKTAQNNVADTGSYSVAGIIQNEASDTDKNGYFLDSAKREAIAQAYDSLGLKAEAKRVRNTLTAPEAKFNNEKVKAEKEKARQLVSKYQNMTEAQSMAFTSRWNKNDPNDKEIKLLRKYATFDGSAPKMR